MSSPPALTPLTTTQAAPTSYPFTLLASHGTDLWAKPRSFDAPASTTPISISNQPSFLTTLKLSQLARAEVNFSFAPSVLYDQAGLVLLFSSGTEKAEDGGK